MLNRTHALLAALVAVAACGLQSDPLLDNATEQSQVDVHQTPAAPPCRCPVGDPLCGKCDTSWWNKFASPIRARRPSPPPPSTRRPIHAEHTNDSKLLELAKETGFNDVMKWNYFDQKHGAPTKFETMADVDMTTEEVFTRYAAMFRLRPGIDALVLEPPRVPNRNTYRFERRRYRQTLNGVPVRGSGYSVEEEYGIFRSATGSITPNIQSTTQPVISEHRAVRIATVYGNPEEPTNPKADLSIVQRGLSIRLIWNVSFESVSAHGPVCSTPFPWYSGRSSYYGINGARVIELDALTGEVTYADDGFRQ